jgi:hypothetical protein
MMFEAYIFNKQHKFYFKRIYTFQMQQDKTMWRASFGNSAKITRNYQSWKELRYLTRLLIAWSHLKGQLFKLDLVHNYKFFVISVKFGNMLVIILISKPHEHFTLCHIPH